MKLVIAIINDDDSRNVMDELRESGFIVTKLCSTGGFLKAGNTTLLTGVDDNQVSDVIQVIQHNSKARKKFIRTGAHRPADTSGSQTEIHVGGATIFVTNIERFEKV